MVTCEIINDEGGILEDIYIDEGAISVILNMTKGPLTDRWCPFQVPPKLKVRGVATSRE